MSGHTLDASTLALWRLNEPTASAVLQDATGRYPLTLNGSVAVVPGLVPDGGFARQFSGPEGTFNCYRGAADATALNAFKGEWTIEMVMQLTGHIPGPASSRAFDLDDGNLPVATRAGKVRIAVGDFLGAAWSTATGDPTESTFEDRQHPLVLGTTYHVALRKTLQLTGTNYSIDVFMNGEMMASNGGFANTVAVASGLTWTLGQGFAGAVPSLPFPGIIDDVRVSSIARTNAEIGASYRACLQAGTSLADLRNQIRQRADMVNSQFVSDAELTSYINSSYFELYDLLVQKYGNNYFVATPYTFTTDGVSDQYPLPTNFYKLLGVDLQLSTSPDSFVSVRPFNFGERNRYALPSGIGPAARTVPRYRLNGANILLVPRASASQTLRLWYVPRLTALSSDADLIDGVSGWEEYIVVDAIIKTKAKQESDVGLEMQQKRDLIKRIEEAAENRNAGSPATVTDVFGSSGFDPGEDC